ncbi:hypothetical protein FOA52_008104 [Chlamydomonas sp. UWO 241]|nr:hypothetical protein FOA52_008104 [Chlamydomonas sp. UWO 241]
MLFGESTSQIATLALGFGWPAYQSFKAASQGSPAGSQLLVREWLQYWTVLAFFVLLQWVGDRTIFWLPLYYDAKVALVLMLWHPQVKGAAYLYTQYLQPLLQQHEADIDRRLTEARSRSVGYVNGHITAARSYTMLHTSSFYEAARRFAEQPVPQGCPMFQPFRAGETTVKLLTTTQVELHKLRTAHNRLSAHSAQQEDKGAKVQSQLEDALRREKLISSEAERRFNAAIAALTKELEDDQGKLAAVEREYASLKGQSEDRIHELTARLNELQTHCGALQAKKADLQDALRRAGLSAEQGRRAVARCAELESAMAATVERSRQIISEMEEKKMEAEHARDMTRSALERTTGALASESAARAASDSDALRLAIDRQRLANALEVERLINEPLRNTTYAATTLSHVMRSAHASPPVASATCGLYVPGGADLTPGSPPVGAPHPDETVVLSVTRAPTELGGNGARGDTRATVAVGRPSNVAETLAGRELTVLGRSWATTTATAGRPPATFADNTERWREVYATLGGTTATATTVTGSRGGGGVGGMGRPSSAPRTHTVASSGSAGGGRAGSFAFSSPMKGPGVPVFHTPQRPHGVRPFIIDTAASGRTVYYS